MSNEIRAGLSVIIGVTLLIGACETFKKAPGTGSAVHSHPEITALQRKVDSLENAVYHDLPEINEMQEFIIERQTEILARLDTTGSQAYHEITDLWFWTYAHDREELERKQEMEQVKLIMAQLEEAGKDVKVKVDGLEYRWEQDSLKQHDRMNIMAREISRIASGHHSNVDSSYIIDGGIEVQQIKGDNFTWMFYHNFLDVKGKVEHKIDFEVGFQQYESLDDVFNNRYEAVWQGFRTVMFSHEDLQIFGEWSAEHGWRRAFEVKMYGLKPGKWYVFSTRATDEAGNQSAWLTSIDTMATPFRFIVHRGR